MHWKFNYLGLLSILSLIGILGFIERDHSHVFTFFAFLSYMGYFFVIPDELFKQRVIETAAITLLLVLTLMVGFFVAYIFTDNANFFLNGFWISFTFMIVVFPLLFTYFQIKDGSHAK